MWFSSSTSSRTAYPVMPGLLLLLAAVLVGIAIVVDGQLGRVVNGVGGAIWLVAAVLLGRELRGARRPWFGAAAVIVVIATLVLVVRPGDMFAALIGFALGGAIVAALVVDRSVVWSLMMVAVWLPGHIALRVALAALAGETRVRTDPPPTAALVPATMVVAALAAGTLVDRLRRRHLSLNARSAVKSPTG